MCDQLCEECEGKLTEDCEEYGGGIVLCRKCADELAKVAGASISRLVTVTRNVQKENDMADAFDDERQELLRLQTVAKTVSSLIVDLRLDVQEDWNKKLAAMHGVENELTRELAELDTFASRGVTVVRPDFSGDRIEPEFFGGRFEPMPDFSTDFENPLEHMTGAGSVAAFLRSKPRKVDTLRVSAHFFDTSCNRWIYNRGREQGGVRIVRLFTWALDPLAMFTRIGIIGRENQVAAKAPVNLWYSVLSPWCFNLTNNVNGRHYINHEIPNMGRLLLNESSNNKIDLHTFNANQTIEFEWEGKVDGIAIITACTE